MILVFFHKELADVLVPPLTLLWNPEQVIYHSQVSVSSVVNGSDNPTLQDPWEESLKQCMESPGNDVWPTLDAHLQTVFLFSQTKSKIKFKLLFHASMIFHPCSQRNQISQSVKQNGSPTCNLSQYTRLDTLPVGRCQISWVSLPCHPNRAYLRLCQSAHSRDHYCV